MWLVVATCVLLPLSSLLSLTLLALSTSIATAAHTTHHAMDPFTTRSSDVRSELSADFAELLSELSSEELGEMDMEGRTQHSMCSNKRDMTTAMMNIANKAAPKFTSMIANFAKNQRKGKRLLEHILEWGDGKLESEDSGRAIDASSKLEREDEGLQLGTAVKNLVADMFFDAHGGLTHKARSLKNMLQPGGGGALANVSDLESSGNEAGDFQTRAAMYMLDDVIGQANMENIAKKLIEQECKLKKANKVPPGVTCGEDLTGTEWENRGVCIEIEIGAEIALAISARGSVGAGICYAPYAPTGRPNVWAVGEFASGSSIGVQAGPTFPLTLSVSWIFDTYCNGAEFCMSNRWRRPDEASLHNGWRFGFGDHFSWEMDVGGMPFVIPFPPAPVGFVVGAGTMFSQLFHPVKTNDGFFITMGVAVGTPSFAVGLSVTKTTAAILKCRPGSEEPCVVDQPPKEIPDFKSWRDLVDKMGNDWGDHAVKWNDILQAVDDAVTDPNGRWPENSKDILMCMYKNVRCAVHYVDEWGKKCADEKPWEQNEVPATLKCPKTPGGSCRFGWWGCDKERGNTICNSATNYQCTCAEGHCNYAENVGVCVPQRTTRPLSQRFSWQEIQRLHASAYGEKEINDFRHTVQQYLHHVSKEAMAEHAAKTDMGGALSELDKYWNIVTGCSNPTVFEPGKASKLGHKPLGLSDMHCVQ